MITQRSEELRRLAIGYCEDLSQHTVLNHYWNDVSLILKGSAARGNSDQYSDIDFVFYADHTARNSIVADYHARGLTTRQDGIFMPLPEWIGHYHVESLEVLNGYFETRNYPQVWECSNVIIMHDPGSRYQNALDAGLGSLFDDPLREVRDRYLQLQLTLDWLRHPLKRGDQIAVLLHVSKITQIACSLCYLLDRKPYPHDKWLFHYLRDTRLGAKITDGLVDYAESLVDHRELARGLELEQYPQYSKALNLTKMITDFITGDYGVQPWLGEWYLFV